MKKILTTLIALLLSSGIVSAGPLEDGLDAYSRGNYTTALGLLQAPATQGDAAAQNALGVIYTKGQMVAQDHKESVRWFQLSAAQGYAAAQANLGGMYYNGRGVAQDDKEAAKWYRGL